MNIPNILSTFRLFLIPVFILFFFSHTKNSLMFSILIFLLAGFTDILDGYIARKYNLITKYGIVLDPLADKLMLITALTCLVIYNYIPFWILIVITLKEFSMIIGGFLLYKNNIVIPSNVLGKLTTFLFYLFMFVFIFNEFYSYYILYLAVISAIVAYINYFTCYFKHKNNHTLKKQ